ncbi:MAG TPA: universal stress protein [Candidatus Angelobacter sp.]
MKVLLAIDDSKCSESAVEMVIKQCQPAGTEVLIVHAIESVKLTPPSYGFGVGAVFVQDFTDILRQWRTAAEELVSRTAARLQAAGFKTSTRVEENDPREMILNCAAQWHPDVIVLGSHGKGRLDRFLLGSVSESVARHAQCTVEIVRGTPAAA